MAGQIDTFNVDAQSIAVGTSAYIGVTAGIGVVRMQTQYISGGTLYMIGASGIGASLTALAYSASNILTSGFLFQSTASITQDGPACFYLAATGSTAICQILRHRSASNPG